MKSKFFGLNAKLALAVLAVGTMFTGCYDSENGDVVKPYEPLPAAYYVVGTVTDLESGAPLSATVAIKAETETESNSTSTDAAGSYRLETSAGNKEITVTVTGDKAADYNEVTRTVTIPEVGEGEVYTAVVNVAMTPNAEEPELEVDVKVLVTSFVDAKVLTSEENVGLDLIAEEEAAVFTRNFIVDAGYSVSEESQAALANASEDMQAYVEAYFGMNLGEYGEAYTLTLPYTFQIPAWNCLLSVTIDYTYNNIEYTFTANTGEVCVVEVNSVAGYAFSAGFLPNHNYTHSHGHGHGHGEDLNAGGGIISPEL